MPLILLHGWSDSSASFTRLARHLARAGAVAGGDVRSIALGDYLSMSDELRFDDLQAALDRAWDDHGLPRTPYACDVVVHSTSALIVRDWLSRHFAVDASPVKHLVMLAPANFGSPLAHVGRSMLGRAMKGFVRRQEGQGLWQTGTQILRGLELASPYSWELAERDRFGDGEGRYGPGRVLCTALVGDTGFRGIQALANEPGGDGAVRIATANLNCAYLRIAITADEREGRLVPHITAQADSCGRAAFRILPGIDHSSIKLDAPPSRLSRAQRGALTHIEQALAVRDVEFAPWCLDCEQANAERTQGPQLPRARPGFQHTVVRVRDQFDAPVPDYLLEFFEPGRRDGGTLASRIHGEAIRGVHVYQADRSYRSLYIDTHRFHRALEQAGGTLGFSLTAFPMLGSGGAVAGFRTFADEDIDDLRLDTEAVAQLLQPHRTLLLDIRLEREQAPSVFRLR
jgi:pimeloyl-ACP methyl ester carboxylesterase